MKTNDSLLLENAYELIQFKQFLISEGYEQSQIDNILINEMSWGKTALAVLGLHLAALGGAALMPHHKVSVAPDKKQPAITKTVNKQNDLLHTVDKNPSEFLQTAKSLIKNSKSFKPKVLLDQMPKTFIDKYRGNFLSITHRIGKDGYNPNNKWHKADMYVIVNVFERNPLLNKSPEKQTKALLAIRTYLGYATYFEKQEKFDFNNSNHLNALILHIEKDLKEQNII
jgi:hypothetical protein